MPTPTAAGHGLPDAATNSTPVIIGDATHRTLVQRFLADNPPELLTEKYAITVKRHPQFQNLVMLKYSQIDSPFAEPIVRECRGIILDEAEGWRVVSRPYDKFFNYGEGHASPLDWSSACVYEKLDGSLMTLYFYRGEWRVASSGLPDAGGQVNNAEVGTFADLFWRVWGGCGYRFPVEHSTHCFMFELMTPANRVVVPYASNRIVLHGVRDLQSGVEKYPQSYAEMYGWECVKSYPLATIDDVVSAASALNPMQNEGYVVCDDKFNRVKVKSPQYVALAHMKEGFSHRRMIELVRANEGEEFLSYFPEFRPEFEKVQAIYRSVVDGARNEYAKIVGILERKAFALAAVATPYRPILFSMRDGKASSPEEFLRNATLPAVERLFNGAA